VIPGEVRNEPSERTLRASWPVSSTSSRTAQSRGDSPSTSRSPAGTSSVETRSAGRNWRTSRMSLSVVIATTAQAPGWRTISQSPVGQVSISRRRYLPRNASRDAAGAARSSGGDDDGLLRSRSPERRRGTDELPEQRMWMRRQGAELRVELSGDEEGMVRKLDDLHETPVLRVARHDQAATLERLLIERVHLEAVAVPLVDDR